MPRFSIHPDSIGDYTRLQEFVTSRCPSALFDSEEEIDDITAAVWISDEEVDAAIEAFKDLGCRFEAD